jgi:hypothetical protein
MAFSASAQRAATAYGAAGCAASIPANGQVWLVIAETFSIGTG